MYNKNSKLREARSLIKFFECTIEIVALSLIYYFVWRTGYQNGLFPDYYYNGKYVLTGIYGILAVIMFSNLDCFRYGDVKFLDITLGQMIALFIVNFITYFQLCLIANGMISPIPMLVVLVFQMVVAIIFLIAYTNLNHKLFTTHNMLLIYGTDNAVGIKFKLDSRKDKYNIQKLISTNVGFEKICEEILKFESVIINDVPSQIRNDILKFCYQNNVRVYMVPKLSDILVRGGKEVNLFDTPLLAVRHNGLSLAQSIMKRTLDIVVSGIATILLSPLMLLVALAIKIEDGGPVFYKQKRLTINQKEFNILKFRSMIPDAEKLTGSVLATEKDPRITKVGRFVRATRLDEIPQVINILKGDMSIVGPRPERKVFVDEYCKEIPEFVYRMKVKGGLTGFAQVYGKYNTNPYDKLRLDLMYIENYSFLLDIKLILLTIRIIFSKESTEGIDVAEKNEQLKEELLIEIKQNEEATL